MRGVLREHASYSYEYTTAWRPLLPSRVEDGRGGSGHSASPRFPSPLIERSVRISRTTLSDWLHLAPVGGAPMRNVSTTLIQRWPAKFGQADKWNFCLRAARMPWIRNNHDKAITPDPCPGLQGKGGTGRHQGREDAGRVGAAV